MFRINGLLCFFILALALLAPTVAFAQATYAERGVVVAVEPSEVQRDPRWNESTATGVGAAIGGLAGYQASDYRERYVAGAVGSLIGAAIGRSIDTRRRSGYEVVIQLEYGRTVAVFQRAPRVRPGDRVFLIGGNRLVLAGPRPEDESTALASY